jgi:pimeloyl-ACP methyl ester carboxylesterase
VSYPQICPGGAEGRHVAEGRFALCGIDFAPSSLTTVDFTVLTAVSYMEYGEKEAALQLFFPNRTVVIDDSASAQALGMNKAFIGVNFTIIRLPDEQVTVVAVRGSFTSIDWLQDLYVMSDTLAIQVGKTVLPLPLSDGVAASLVALGGSFKFGMKSYTKRVEDAISAIRRSRPDDSVFITGHSLGGFTANVVAAKTRTRSVTMSPIGTGFTYKRYDFTKEAADEFQLSIIPEGDLVPKIDEQLGLQQYFVNPEGCTPANAFCHALASTLRVITANCGDKLGRRVVSTRQDHC